MFDKSKMGKMQVNQPEPIKTETKSSIIPEGQRANTLMSLGGKYLKKGLKIREIEFLLAEINKKDCKPPVEADQIADIMISLCGYQDEIKKIIPTRIQEFQDATKFPDPVPIIDGLINRGEFHICSATAKTGKTFLQMYLSLCISRGQKFLGFETVKSRVLIVQTEVSESQIRKRAMHTFGDSIKDEDVEVYFVGERIKLNKEEGLTQLRDLVDELKVDFVVLDPFYTLHTANEDSSTDMAPILSDVRDIARDKDIAILMIHHQGKQNENGGRQTGHKHRGSSSFADAPDGSWSLQRTEEDKVVNLSFEMRNVESPKTMRLVIDERMHFKKSGTVETNETKIIDEIVEVVREDSGLSNKELTDRVSTRLNTGKRTVQNRIKDAIAMNKIIKKKDGSKMKYYLCATFAGLQPLKEMQVANDFLPF